MNVLGTPLSGLLLVEPRSVGDERGALIETYHALRYPEQGVSAVLVFDLLTHSTKGTIRGLHFQEPRPQGKLVQVVHGAVFDVAVDIRRDSPTFGKWFSVELSHENMRQLWIPSGFAHGFCVLSATASVHYKLTDYYVPEAARTIRWNDPDLAIPWPELHPILSEKDAGALLLSAQPILP
ncbi:MAG: dTDP-4-dehydrorhamnose 3,5-epimerase [Deltaproteobacteria bacterium]|nr:dTDP-4-dehydrorhamnose 3,5-epimerase [Deltaproteobacteria bacterium]